MKGKRTSTSCRKNQRGLSLFVGLIMLILLTLLGISSFNSSNVNLRIIGNTQIRHETLAAGQTAIEQVVSAPTFVKTAPAGQTVTLNGASYDVAFTPAPTCVAVVDIPHEDLHPETILEDKKCTGSDVKTGSGIFTAASAPMTCANTRWEVTAKVTDPASKSGSDTTLTQGVAVRISKAKALTYCP